MITLDSSIYFDYFYVSNWYKDRKRYREAIKIIEKTMKIKPSAEAYYYLGKIYRARHHNESALEYYEKAIRLNPSLSGVYEDIAHYFS